MDATASTTPPKPTEQQITIRGAAVHVPVFDGPIVLGLEGSESGRGAVALALALARERGAHLRIVSVIEPSRSALLGDDPDTQVRAAMMEGERRRTVTELLGIADGLAGREVEIVNGCAVNLLVELARSAEAELIVIGSAHHHADGQAFSDNTALRVMRRSPIPVVAVAPEVTALPRAAVVGMDFSRSSVRAARAALKLLAPHGTLYLAHVRPDFTTAAIRAEGLKIIYEQGIGRVFDRVQRELALAGDSRVEPVVLSGAPACALSAFARQAEAQLIALGTSRHDHHDARAVGRLANVLVREGSHTILAAPPPPRTLRRVDHED